MNHENKSGESALTLSCRREYDYDIVVRLIKAGADIEHANHDGTTSLLRACGNTNEEITRELVRAGANVNHVDPSDGFSPLLQACRGGASASFISVLVEAGADLHHAEYHEGNRAVFYACDFSRLDVLRYLLKSGARVSDLNNCEDSVLTFAYRNSNVRSVTVETLLEAGLDVNHVNEDGNSALILACHDRDDCATVPTLLAAGAIVDHANNSGKTALLRACEGGHIRAINALIAAGANVNYANGQGEMGETPLLVACSHGNLSTVRALIAAGVDVNCVDSDGDNCLFLSTYDDNFAIVQSLLAAGAKLSHENEAGDTALIQACRKKAKHTAKLLIAKGSDLSHVNEAGYTAFVAACEAGSVSIVLQLLESGRPIDIEHEIKDGSTALLRACGRRDGASIVRALIEAGANVHHANPCSHLFPLLNSCRSGSIETVRLLLEAGAIDVEKAKDLGKALRSAVANQRSSIVRLLLKSACIDLSSLDEDGNSALSLACEHQNSQIVNQLLVAGANVNHVNPKTGDTPLIVSCRRRSAHSAIVRLLLEAGADVKHSNLEGVTAIMEIIKRDDSFPKDILLQLLRDAGAVDPPSDCKKSKPDNEAIMQQ